MENITPGEIWTVVAWVAAAIVLLGNASDRIAKAWRAAKAPNDEQNSRLDALEKWRKEVDSKLNNDHEELATVHEDNRAIFQALLALLDHGIDGNNIKQMEDAKKGLQSHLISHK